MASHLRADGFMLLVLIPRGSSALTIRNSNHSGEFSNLFFGHWPARPLDALDGLPTDETFVLAQASAQTGKSPPVDGKRPQFP